VACSGACLVAVFAGVISELFQDPDRSCSNAAILALAVVMLTWHNVWMAGGMGASSPPRLRAAGEAVAAGKSSLFALAVVVGVAVLREGAEVVLFLYGSWRPRARRERVPRRHDRSLRSAP